jgi:hypothetical protein
MLAFQRDIQPRLGGGKDRAIEHLGGIVHRLGESLLLKIRSCWSHQ